MTISHIILKWALVILLVISVSSEKVSPKSLVTSPAPAPADCMTLIYSMSDCLTYVEKGSNVTKPEKSCCPELAGMLDTNPICLCQLLAKSKDFPVELDVNRALNLPHICGLQTPSLSNCSGIPIGGPTGAPSSSQGPSSSGGMSADEAGETSADENGASNTYFRLLNLLVGFAMVFTLFIL